MNKEQIFIKLLTSRFFLFVKYGKELLPEIKVIIYVTPCISCDVLTILGLSRMSRQIIEQNAKQYLANVKVSIR